MIKKNFDLSIITVVKNDVQNIEKTIKSIINQKNNQIEYIIVDGKSDDGTLEIVNKYKNKINKIISESDNGIYYAMNKGIDVSNGTILGFCNSGDIIYSNRLADVISKFRKDDLDVLFATVKRHYLGKTIIKSGVKINRIKYNFDFATAHSTGFYLKKKIHDEIGVYNTKFQLSADYDFYYRLIKLKKYKIGSTEKNLIFGEMSKGGFSSNFTYLEHLKEEIKIRFHNKQNILLILTIYINSILKNLKKIIKL